MKHRPAGQLGRLTAPQQQMPMAVQAHLSAEAPQAQHQAEVVLITDDFFERRCSDLVTMWLSIPRGPNMKQRMTECPVGMACLSPSSQTSLQGKSASTLRSAAD